MKTYFHVLGRKFPRYESSIIKELLLTESSLKLDFISLFICNWIASFADKISLILDYSFWKVPKAIESKARIAKNDEMMRENVDKESRWKSI